MKVTHVNRITMQSLYNFVSAVYSVHNILTLNAIVRCCACIIVYQW